MATRAGNWRPGSRSSIRRLTCLILCSIFDAPRATAADIHRRSPRDGTAPSAHDTCAALRFISGLIRAECGFVYIWQTSHAVPGHFLCGRPAPSSCHRRSHAPRVQTHFSLLFREKHFPLRWTGALVTRRRCESAAKEGDIWQQRGGEAGGGEEGRKGGRGV